MSQNIKFLFVAKSIDTPTGDMKPTSFNTMHPWYTLFHHLEHSTAQGQSVWRILSLNWFVSVWL